MSWAQELKSLAEEIKDGHGSRRQFLHDLKQQVKTLQKDAREFLAKTQRELAEMAKDLRALLAKSEETRMEGETSRQKDFDVLIKNIQGDIKRIQKDTAQVRHEARGLLARFQGELKELSADLKKLFADVHKDLAAGKESRMRDFKELMNRIGADLEGLQKATANVRKDARNLIGDFAKERHEAGAYWATLSGKGAAAHHPAAHKRGRPRKKA